MIRWFVARRDFLLSIARSTKAPFSALQMPPQLPGEMEPGALLALLQMAVSRKGPRRGRDHPGESCLLHRVPCLTFSMSGCLSGVMAGFNMGGDLREPAVSVPLGSLAAVGIS